MTTFCREKDQMIMRLGMFLVVSRSYLHTYNGAAVG